MPSFKFTRFAPASIDGVRQKVLTAPLLLQEQEAAKGRWNR